MNKLNKLGLIFSVGTLAAFAIAGCSDDTTTPGTTAGTSAGGSAAGTNTTAGSGGAAAGSGTTGGAGAAGTATGGGGSGGAAAGSGGGGSGGAAAGSGGTGGGGAGGGGGSGGMAGGGGGGGAPSAACMKWCVGDSGLLKKCMGSNLLNPTVDSVDKCLTYCAKPEAAAGLSCWQTHLDNVKMMADQNPHCGHASGLAASNPNDMPCKIIP